jgi:hypothetical protein
MIGMSSYLMSPTRLGHAFDQTTRHVVVVFVGTIRNELKFCQGLLANSIDFQRFINHDSVRIVPPLTPQQRNVILVTSSQLIMNASTCGGIKCKENGTGGTMIESMDGKDFACQLFFEEGSERDFIPTCIGGSMNGYTSRFADTDPIIFVPNDGDACPTILGSWSFVSTSSKGVSVMY